MNKIKKIVKPAIHPEQLRQFQSIMIRLLQCCHERMRYQSEKFGLPDAELRCLMLFDGERYLTPKGITGKLNVVKSRITKVIDGLVKRGLVQKVKDPGDARITLLSLSPGGQSKIAEIKEFNDWIHREVLTALEPEQRKIMLANLDMLKASMESTRAHLICGPVSQD
jgi:DNA-binding MarR family transcriptional regulator